MQRNWRRIGLCVTSAQQVHPGTVNFGIFGSAIRQGILTGPAPKAPSLGSEDNRATEVGRKKRGMTVKTTNRSHRVIYMVVLLVFAVALTTALVLAAERSPEGAKSSSLQSNAVPVLGAVCLWGNRDV